MSYDFVAYLIVFVLSFLLGSVPFGLIISRLFYKTDLRAHGSGNIGTTNAIRAMGKTGGFSVFILDFSKGVFSGFLALWVGQACAAGAGQEALAESIFNIWQPLTFVTWGLGADPHIAYVENLVSIALCACVLGHIFSPWLKFKGGKGIAVAIGCVFVTYGVIGAALELALFIALVISTKYVSVGSVAAGVACPFIGLYLFFGNATAIFFCTLTGCVVVWAHRENLKRLFAGTENKIGKKKRSKQGG